MVTRLVVFAVRLPEFNPGFLTEEYVVLDSFCIRFICGLMIALDSCGFCGGDYMG